MWQPVQALQDFAQPGLLASLLKTLDLTHGNLAVILIELAAEIETFHILQLDLQVVLNGICQE